MKSQELFRREAQAAAARALNGVPDRAGVVETPVGPPPFPLTNIEMVPQELNAGLTPDGKKVLRFRQGFTVVTILFSDEGIRKGAVKGLTGVDL